MSAARKNRRIAWSLWIPVILLFVITTIGWIVMVRIAKENPVEMIEVRQDP